VNTESPRQPAVHKPRMLRWVAWTVLILMGGTILVAVIAAFVTAAVDGLDIRKLQVLLAIVCVAALIACLKSALNPMRRRPDQMNRWREQFPTQSEEEIERFLQVVGGALGLQALQLCKLSPDDRGADFEPLFGGLELVQVLMAVEEAYGLDLPESFLEICKNLGELFAYVTQHGTVRPVSPATGLRNQLTNATKST
jgi:hypothetical protein